ncbi:MAG: FkbM family methyltransferase [Euryarchaeota archaeon]|nr:FkbM family methyltransferase [Euryarchaeota archaeon]
MEEKMSLKKIFGLLPERSIKHKIRCIYYNNFKDIDFQLSYKKGHYTVTFKDGIVIKFYNNPCGILTEIVKEYFLKYKLKKGDIVIDAGAWFGPFAIYAASQIGPTGKVIVFEPDPLNYIDLKNNILLNNLNNIVAINKGLWNTKSTLRFFSIGKYSGGSHILFDDSLKENKGYVEISVVSLDEELKLQGISQVDFIKMDIEGAEIEAIEGSKNILQNRNTNLAIATYHIRNGEMTCKKVEHLLKSYGYYVESLNPHHLTTYATPIDSRN